jgi:Fe-S oxidoreductase
MSASLLAPKIEHLRQLGATQLVTTNTGCALHLAAGAREAGMELEVLHPVELIERQLAHHSRAAPDQTPARSGRHARLPRTG